MRKQAIAALSWLCICLGAGSAIAADPTSRQPVTRAGLEGERIAVVSISRVFKSYKKVARVEQRLKEEFSVRQKRMKTEADKLRDWELKISAQVDETKPKPRELIVEIQHFELAKLDLNERVRDLGKAVEERQMAEMKQVLREIRAAIRAVARKGRYDLIVRAPEFDSEGNRISPTVGDPESESPRTSAELVRRFRENPVLFFASSVDVTSDVISALNREYAHARGSSSRNRSESVTNRSRQNRSDPAIAGE